jgi:PKD repeat protein
VVDEAGLPSGGLVATVWASLARGRSTLADPCKILLDCCHPVAHRSFYGRRRSTIDDTGAIAMTMYPFARGSSRRIGRPWRGLAVAVAAAATLLGAVAGPAQAFDFLPLEPVAIFTVTPSTGEAPLTVTFDGRASTGPNPLDTWIWTFGDGSTGMGNVTTHTYMTPGAYNATLVVYDGFGLNSFPSVMTILVNAPTPPQAPANIIATSLSRSSIRLGWTNVSSNQTSVEIERCKGVGCTKFVRVATVSGTATSFTDTKLPSRTTYTYRVRSGNTVGFSPYSNLASARTLR